MVAVESTAGGVIVPVRVRAGARRTCVVGAHDGALRIDVSAAPEKGKANKALLGVLAKELGLRKSQLSLLAGETKQKKQFLVRDVNAVQLAERIAAALTAGRRD